MQSSIVEVRVENKVDLVENDLLREAFITGLKELIFERLGLEELRLKLKSMRFDVPLAWATSSFMTPVVTARRLPGSRDAEVIASLRDPLNDDEHVLWVQTLIYHQWWTENRLPMIQAAFSKLQAGCWQGLHELKVVRESILPHLMKQEILTQLDEAGSQWNAQLEKIAIKSKAAANEDRGSACLDEDLDNCVPDTGSSHDAFSIGPGPKSHSPWHLWPQYPYPPMNSCRITGAQN